LLQCFDVLSLKKNKSLDFVPLSCFIHEQLLHLLNLRLECGLAFLLDNKSLSELSKVFVKKLDGLVCDEKIFQILIDLEALYDVLFAYLSDVFLKFTDLSSVLIILHFHN
jgi:hypothetical protein